MISSDVVMLVDRVVAWAVVPLIYFILRMSQRLLVLETRAEERYAQRAEDRDAHNAAIVSLQTSIEKLRESIEKLHARHS